MKARSRPLASSIHSAAAGVLPSKLSGFLDLFAGGIEIQRGRQDSDNLIIGDAIDFS